jgi:rhodanese-related sulfurtransferase
MIFDARPAVFHAMGHIPGAISLPKNGCDEAILARGDEIRTALAGGRTLVVYCTGLLCPDARAVAMRLASYGHPARIFSGGWDAWRDAGMPTE